MNSFSRFSFRYLLGLALMFGLMLPSLHAQGIKFGPRIAVSSAGIQPQDLMIRDQNDFDALSVKLQDASPEYQVGAFARVSLLGLYVQPEVLVSTATATYLYENMTDGSTGTAEERYFNLEVPVMAGIKFGPFRVQGGPVYRMNLAGTSDLKDIEGLGRKFSDASLGFQGGVGLDLGKKIVLDLKYETAIPTLNDEVTFLGQTHTLNQHSGQLIGSLGISF